MTSGILNINFRAAKGLKPLLHLEAFTAKVMSIFYENRIAIQ